MKLVIDHLTRYGYDEEVKFSTQYLRLTPRSSGRQKITAWTLTLPDGSAVATTDAWGNVLHVLTLDNPHKEITIRASGIVDIAEEGDDIGAEPQELLSPLVFLRCTPLTRADGPIREFAQRWYQPEAQEESLNRLMAELLLRMPYSPPPGAGLRRRCLCARERGLPGSHPRVSRLLPGAGDPGALRQRLRLQR
jgi:transglutaminase-like putative cysteine protease